MAYTEFTEPNVCIDENLTTSNVGLPLMQRWAVPRLVASVRAASGGDGRLTKSEISLPGKPLINRTVEWVNDTPLEQPVRILVTRASRSILTSNPNAIQVRDRWTYAIDAEPEDPTVTSIFNGQFGGAIDLGTNSVSEPEPGRLWLWAGTNSEDEWISPKLQPGQKLKMWYKCFVWTPPPWSNNANKNSPEHEVYVNWTRLQLIAHPQQGTVVTG